jgi:hypothetical protein
MTKSHLSAPLIEESPSPASLDVEEEVARPSKIGKRIGWSGAGRRTEIEEGGISLARRVWTA